MRHFSIVFCLMLIICLNHSFSALYIENDKQDHIEIINDTITFTYNNQIVLTRTLDRNIQREKISANKKNIVVAETSDTGKEEKIKKWFLNLYNVKGELLGVSESIDLYDHDFLPTGNDTTVLIYIEMAGFGTTIYNSINSRLVPVKSFKYDDTHYGILAPSFSGHFFGIGLTCHKDYSSSVRLFNCNGKELLSTIAQYPLNQLFISDDANYSIGIIRGDNTKHLEVINMYGESVLDLNIGEIGQYKAEFNNDTAVIYTHSNLYLLDLKDNKLLVHYTPLNDSIRIADIDISDPSSIIVKENYLEIVSKRIPPIVKQENYFRLDLQGRKKTIENINNL